MAFSSRGADNARFRFGSADWASSRDLRRAKMFKRPGLQIGYWGPPTNARPLYIDSDAPLITFGGAGSGKLRDLLAYVVCNTPGERMVILDPRNELAAISMHVHGPRGEHGYCWRPVENPNGAGGLPRHACNPLSILRADSPYFHGDCAFIAEALVPPKPGAHEPFFNQRAQDWIGAIIKHDVESNGWTSLPRIARIVNMIEGDVAAWATLLESMMSSLFEDVRRAANEMLTKQQDSQREFGSVMGETYSHLKFLDDPSIRRWLEDDGDGFDLSILCDPDTVSKVYLNVPAEYLGLWSPVIRLFFTVAMLQKSRRPDAPRVNLIADEAGQLGRFDALLRSFTYGRGAGIRAWALFQSIGQVTRNFGPSGPQDFIASAQVRQFVGVRDYQTAKLVSDMLGNETLHYPDPAQQREAARRRAGLAANVLAGDDPFACAADLHHHDWRAAYCDVQSRRLMTPEEVLALPEDRQILFISGMNLKPVLAAKYPYFTRREMAGLYLGNPFHPPVNAVRVATRWGMRSRRVITEPVPEKLASFPQYQAGTWSYVEGYRPNL